MVTLYSWAGKLFTVALLIDFFSLWKQSFNVLCGSGGVFFSMSEKITMMMSSGLSQLYIFSWKFLLSRRVKSLYHNLWGGGWRDFLVKIIHRNSITVCMSKNLGFSHLKEALDSVFALTFYYEIYCVCDLSIFVEK